MTDAEMLTGQSLTLKIDGREYVMLMPTRRRSRVLMAGIMRMLPAMTRLRSEIAAMGGVVNVDRLTGDVAAAMLDVYEPVCAFLEECLPEAKGKLDNASEPELIRAFVAIQDFLKGPLAVSASALNASTPQQSAETQPSSIPAPLGNMTMNGSPASTK